MISPRATYALRYAWNCPKSDKKSWILKENSAYLLTEFMKLVLWLRNYCVVQILGRGESRRSWGKVDGPTGWKWTVRKEIKWTVQKTNVDGPQRMKLDGLQKCVGGKGGELSTDRPRSGPSTFPRTPNINLEPFFKIRKFHFSGIKFQKHITVWV